MPLKTLRLLVFGLGICVVLAFAVLVAVIVQRGGRPAEEAAMPRGAVEPPLIAAERAPWGRLALDQPAGTRIQSVTSSGDFIVLHLYTGAPGQDERIVVLDPANGGLVGTFALGAK
ncbi:MAG: hypothetical protein JNK67_27985 [Alphaproteobacteria bacterium]|nr:hypothetical protein [Alphaproteobacteria bacterium]